MIGNWTDIALQDIISYAIGGDWGYNPEESIDDSTLAYCIRGSEIKEWNKNRGKTAVIRRIKNSSLENRKLEIGDILLEISGGGPEQPVGRVLYIDEETIKTQDNHPIVCTNFFRRLHLNDTVCSRYVYYYLHFFYIIGNTISLQGGSNNLRNLKFKDYQLIRIPLPSLTEQKQIAEKLDKLFDQIETIKEASNKIPELLKNFRQQVLTYAVTGKLTNSDFAHWEKSTIGTIGKVKGGKRLPKGEELVNYNTGYPYIRARDLKEGTVLKQNIMYLLPETQEKIKNYIVKTNDVYITIVGAKIGDAGIIPESMNNANLTENAAKITDLSEKIMPQYLSLWLQAPLCQSEIQQSIKSAAQGKLALTRINSLSICFPPIESQKEIIDKVEYLLGELKIIESKFYQLQNILEKLPQALLCKAFKGELL